MAANALRKQAQAARRSAEAALGDKLAETGASLDNALRCEQAQLNIVKTISPGRWAQIAAQLGGGNGSELKPAGTHRPKFCSAFSSCALAVNTFGVFDATRTMSLPEISAFPGSVEFEAQRSAGVRGYKPNLDLVAEPVDGDWLFAESKCLEYLRPHRTAFSDAFVSKAKDVFSAGTAAVYTDFAATKKTGGHIYELLDAAQLLKHFLAAKFASGSQRKVVLAYLFWEPADEAGHAVFAAHRDEAQKLAGVLADEHVRLVPLGYRDLWSHWETLGDPVLSAHVAALRARYDVPLNPAG